MAASYGGPVRLLAGDLLGLARRLSLREVAGKAARRARGAIRSEDSVIVLVKDLDDVVATPLSGRLRIEPIGPAQLPALHELNRRRCATRKTRRFVADLERGCEGFVAISDGDVVGYYWYARPEVAAGHRDLRRLGRRIELGDGDLYGYDFFLLEEARGRNAAAEVLTLVETALRDRGHRRVWGYVEAGNRPARWLYATRRYRPTERLTTRTAIGYRSTQVGPPERG